MPKSIPPRTTGAVCALLVLSLMGSAAATPAGSGREIPPVLLGLIETATDKGEIRLLVSVRDMAAQRTVLDTIDKSDARVLHRYEILPYLLLEAGPDTVRSLVHDPLVTGFTEDLPEKATLDSSIPVVNGDDVRALGLRGGGTAVAILDSGIDLDHPFLGNVVSEACYSDFTGTSSGTSLCDGGAHSDVGPGAADVESGGDEPCISSGTNICSHGSHVAGIAMGDGDGLSGAPAAGVAPDSDLVAVQVFTRFDNDTCGTDPIPCTRTFPADQVRALEHVLALKTGDALGSEIVAVNMSLGGGHNATACDSDSRKAAIDLLAEEDIATVVSAGNSGHLSGVAAPGCISTAITVGATRDDDNLYSATNRGALLDLLAPGNAVVASIPDDAYGVRSGTSMAAPHVTGAWAVLRGEYPDATVAEILGILQDTGLAITYPSGGTDVTTPRIDLLAASQFLNDSPVIDRDVPSVTASEGQTAVNTGTFSDPNGDPLELTSSIGTVTDIGGGAWTWSFGTSDGPAQGQTVTISATDDKAESASVTFPLVVDNVAPSVAVDPQQVTTISEGDFLSASGTFSDPGWADTYGSTFDWGTPAGDTSAGTTNVATHGPPSDQGTSIGSFQYGDDGTFDVEVGVTDDDGGTGSDSFTVAVANVAPTAEIDLSDAVDVNGIPTILGETGVPVGFSARSTDPGSDDLVLGWDWRLPSFGAVVEEEYPVNPPAADPPSSLDPSYSPDVQPRDVTHSGSTTFVDACRYTVTFHAADDDGGATTDQVRVIITRGDRAPRGPGYWRNQLHAVGDFTRAELHCLLRVVSSMSPVLARERDVSTQEKALEVIEADARTMSAKLDRFLVTSWLNFGNGPFDLGDRVDTDGDGTPDTTFATALATAEAVRLDPASTRAQLEAQKNILERINGK